MRTAIRFSKKGKDDDDDAKNADKSADGIGVVDVAQKRFLRKISVGSDPEQLGLSADGKKLFASNEDVGTASVLDIASGKVEHIIPVSREPEGVAVSPDGKFFYVTCETEGEIYAIARRISRSSTISTSAVGHARRIFLPDSSRAFIPSESSGQLHVIDSTNHKIAQDHRAPEGLAAHVRTGDAGWKKNLCQHRTRRTVCVLAADTGDVLNTIKVGTRPWGIDISLDGNFSSPRTVRPMTFPWWTSGPRRKSRESNLPAVHGALSWCRHRGERSLPDVENFLRGDALGEARLEGLRPNNRRPRQLDRFS